MLKGRTWVDDVNVTWNHGLPIQSKVLTTQEHNLKHKPHAFKMILKDELGF